MSPLLVSIKFTLNRLSLPSLVNILSAPRGLLSVSKAVDLSLIILKILHYTFNTFQA